MSVGPDDLLVAADLCRRFSLAHAGEDWSLPAPHVGWSCREVLEHICSLHYATTLATRATVSRRDGLVAAAGLPLDAVIDGVYAQACVLAEVARACPADVVAHHVAGMADASGFVAMGIDEQLVHHADIAEAFGVPFEVPDELVVRLLDRLFPWWPREAEPWHALRWANGRGVLPGHAAIGDAWVWHCAPLERWDGSVPVWDATTGSVV